MGAKAAETLKGWVLPGRTLHTFRPGAVAFLKVRGPLLVLQVKVGLGEDKDQWRLGMALEDLDRTSVLGWG